MSGCYYCGKIVRYQCDYISGGAVCNREVCADCCVPEFEGRAKSDFTLCKDHAKYQVRCDESMPDYFARMEKIA